MQTGGETFPAHIIQLFINATDQPDLASHRADGRAAIAEEIVAADEEKRSVGILERDGDGVCGEGCLRAEHAPRLDPLRPLRRAALGEVLEVFAILARGRQMLSAVA